MDKVIDGVVAILILGMVLLVVVPHAQDIASSLQSTAQASNTFFSSFRGA